MDNMDVNVQWHLACAVIASAISHGSDPHCASAVCESLKIAQSVARLTAQRGRDLLFRVDPPSPVGRGVFRSVTNLHAAIKGDIEDHKEDSTTLVRTKSAEIVLANMALRAQHEQLLERI
jgi:hypothetical protein